MGERVAGWPIGGCLNQSRRCTLDVRSQDVLPVEAQAVDWSSSIVTVR